MGYGKVETKQHKTRTMYVLHILRNSEKSLPIRSLVGTALPTGEDRECCGDAPISKRMWWGCTLIKAPLPVFLGFSQGAVDCLV